MSDKQLLFVGGNPRSGTTALVGMLNTHPDILMGDELYIVQFKKNEIEANAFEKDVLIKHAERRARLRKDNLERSGPITPAERERLLRENPFTPERYDEAKLVGDKCAELFRTYDYLWNRFPSVKVLHIVRNPLSVAESYETRKANDENWVRNTNAAIEDWNRSVTRTVKALDEGRDITVVSYEKLFSSVANMRKLLTHLTGRDYTGNTEALEAIETKFRSKVASKAQPRSEDMRLKISMMAKFQPYRRLVNDHCILRDPVAEAVA